MKTGFLYFLLAVLLVGGGTSVYYFFGYKDSSWIRVIAYILITLGWSFVFFDMILIYPAALDSPAKRKAAAGNPIIKTLKRMFFFLCFAVWMLMLLFNFIMLDEWMQNRVTDILATQPFTSATARVIKIEERQARWSTHFFAIIQYKTPDGTIKQAFQDDKRHYNTGDSINIRYSNQYIDMFELSENK